MFKDIWNEYFPSCEPFAWTARNKFSNIWYRIHSLPESKRYPEDDQERQSLLERHNTAASLVLTEGAKCWLSWYGDEVTSGFIGTKICDYADDWLETTVYATEIVWKSRKYDEFILKVADSETSSAIFMSDQTGNVYSPYDGGADIFIHDDMRREEVRKQLQAWLSPFESGL